MGQLGLARVKGAAMLPQIPCVIICSYLKNLRMNPSLPLEPFSV